MHRYTAVQIQNGVSAYFARGKQILAFGSSQQHTDRMSEIDITHCIAIAPICTETIFKLLACHGGY